MQPIPIQYHRGKWEVEERVSYRVKGLRITIPKGFKTDLASVPRILWVIFPPFGSYNTASIVHDYLYKKQKVSRKKADEIFLVLMERGGTNWATRWLFYLAVRAFGRLAFKKNKKCLLTKTKK